MSCELLLTNIVSKEGAQHGMDIITDIGAEQYPIYYAEANTNLGTYRWFNKLGICYKGYIENKTDTERHKAKKYWIFVETLYDIKEENNEFEYLSIKNIRENIITSYCDKRIGILRENVYSEY
eukprot:137103_1